jgi:hypothetical protein
MFNVSILEEQIVYDLLRGTLQPQPFGLDKYRLNDGY